MQWIRRNLPWLLLALVLVTSVGVVGALGVGAIVVLQGLLTGAAVGAILGDLALAVGAAVLLVALDLAFVLALVVTVVRRASLPRGERLSSAAATLERYCPPLGRFDLADRFAPTVADRRERLRRRYVEGDLSELEFERRLDDLLDDEADVGPTDRESSPGADDGGRDLEVRSEPGDAESSAENPTDDRSPERDRDLAP